MQWHKSSVFYIEEQLELCVNAINEGLVPTEFLLGINTLLLSRGAILSIIDDKFLTLTLFEMCHHNEKFCLSSIETSLGKMSTMLLTTCDIIIFKKFMKDEWVLWKHRHCVSNICAAADRYGSPKVMQFSTLKDEFLNSKYFV